MKKIIALVLAIMMIASMSVVVFADYTLEDTDEPIQGTSKNEIPVNYTVTKGYTITIPEKFDLEEKTDDQTGLSHGEGSGTVSIKAAKLDGGEILEVAVTSANAPTGKDYAGNNIADDWAWMMPDTKATGTKAASVGYSITMSGDKTGALAREGVVIDYKYNDTPITAAGIDTLMTVLTANTSQAGIYQDKLTFTVTIGTITQS